MLQRDPDERPSAYAVDNHIFFWTRKKQLDFIKVGESFYD
jgi:hypothetical protein